MTIFLCITFNHFGVAPMSISCDPLIASGAIHIKAPWAFILHVNFKQHLKILIIHQMS
jgi:hypothetical protein